MHDAGDGGNDLAAPPGTPSVGRRTLVGALIAGAAVLALVGALLASRRGGQSNAEPDVAAVARQAAAEMVEEADAAPQRAAVAYRTILPSIVVVRTGDTQPTSDGQTADTGPPTSAEQPTDASQAAATVPDSTTAAPARGLGTGVVIDDSGAVLTALHVVAGATTISVGFADGTEARAEVTASDPARDIAVLAVDQLPEVLVPAVLGGGLAVGDEVFAVGHPLGLTASLSAGVVSALDRSIPTDTGQLDGLIQFDAAANPGNSGGPLLNRNGHVVGIVTALANPSEQPFFVGIGFAVPIASAGGVAGGPSQ